MSNPSAGGADFIKDNAKIVFPVLGALGALVLLGGAYAIWRGPQRAFLPSCLTRRMRRNISDNESVDNEKRVPSPVPIPRRAEPGRDNGRRGRGVSSADEFKREVVASLYGGQMEWVKEGGDGQDADVYGARAGGHGMWGGAPMVGAGGKGGEMDIAEHRMGHVQTSAAGTPLPQRRSSLDNSQVVVDGAAISLPSTSLYPGPPPPSAQPHSYGSRRISNAHGGYQGAGMGSGGRRDMRVSHVPHHYNGVTGVGGKANGHDSNMW